MACLAFVSAKRLATVRYIALQLMQALTYANVGYISSSINIKLR